MITISAVLQNDATCRDDVRFSSLLDLQRARTKARSSRRPFLSGKMCDGEDRFFGKRPNLGVLI
jgi:hypothetical protein